MYELTAIIRLSGSCRLDKKPDDALLACKTFIEKEITEKVAKPIFLDWAAKNE